MSEKKLGIIELLRRVGEDNIRLQNIEHDASNVRLCRGGRECEVSFFTDPNFISPTSVATGQTKFVPLVLWLPKELVEKAKVDPQEGEVPRA